MRPSPIIWVKKLALECANEHFLRCRVSSDVWMVLREHSRCSRWSVHDIWTSMSSTNGSSKDLMCLRIIICDAPLTKFWLAERKPNGQQVNWFGQLSFTNADNGWLDHCNGISWNPWRASNVVMKAAQPMHGLHHVGGVAVVEWLRSRPLDCAGQKFEKKNLLQAHPSSGEGVPPVQGEAN